MSVTQPTKNTRFSSPRERAISLSFSMVLPSPAQISFRFGHCPQAIFMARSRVGWSFTGSSRATMPPSTSPGS